MKVNNLIKHIKWHSVRTLFCIIFLSFQFRFKICRIENRILGYTRIAFFFSLLSDTNFSSDRVFVKTVALCAAVKSEWKSIRDRRRFNYEANVVNLFPAYMWRWEKCSYLRVGRLSPCDINKNYRDQAKIRH